MSEDKQKLVDQLVSFREESEGAKEEIDEKVNQQRLLSVDGIGEETAYQIIEQLGEQGLKAGQILEVDDLTDLKGIGPATAKDVEDVFAKDGTETVEEDVSEESQDEQPEEANVEAEQAGEREDIETSPTARKLSQVRKEHSGPAQKYIGKTRR
jgi:ribosomal protein S13